MPSQAVRDAAKMASQGRVEEAQTLLEAAGGAGDAVALFTLATWWLGGHPLSRDLPKARGALRKAVEIGHVDAALMEVALTANGTGAPVDWRGALALLEIAARDDPVAAQQFALLGAMKFDEHGMPLQIPTAETLSISPHVNRFPGLFSAQECNYVAHIARPLLEPAVVVSPETGKLMQHPVRTSLGTVIGPTREDLVVAALNRRIAAISGMGFQHGEPLAVLAYNPGQEYRPHFDALPHTANQRVKTVLVYLNEGFEGGETLFVANGLKVAPRAGDAILFDNATPGGDVDPKSRHAGLPVIHGIKWLATRWIRALPYDSWNPS
jgi:prolyl 4-hydroxylase